MSRSCTPFDHFSKLYIFDNAMRMRMGRLRSYPCENTRSHPNSEVKHMWAGLVEWWVTTFESPVLKTFLFFFVFFFTSCTCTLFFFFKNFYFFLIFFLFSCFFFFFCFLLCTRHSFFFFFFFLTFAFLIS